MNLKYQSFGGSNHFRPQPEILINKNLKIFAVITPWGSRHKTKELADFLVQNYENYKSQEDITSFFPKLLSLTQEENNLRNLVLSCNQWIFKEQNKSQKYNFGYEMVIGSVIDNQILLVQIGHPFIYLDKQNLSLQALGHVLDLSGGFSHLENKLPPLPSQLMGLYPDTHFSVFNIPIQKKDRLILMSRTFVPAHILDIKTEDRTLDYFSMELSKDDKDMPFWIGILDFAEAS